MIIHRFAHLLADSAPDATLGHNLQLQRLHIHRERIRRTFGDASMTPLPRSAEPMRNGRHPHADAVDCIHLQQRLRCAGGDAGKIFAQDTRRLIGENDRRAVLHMTHERARFAGLDTVAAFCTAVEEERFIDGARRPQPIRSAWKYRGHRHRILLFGKFLRGFGNREDRILEKIAPAV